MMLPCPTCGHVSESRYTFSEPQNRLSDGHKSVRLTVVETRLFKRLLQDPSHTKRHDQLIFVLYTREEPGDAKNVLKVTISRLRKKLALVNLKIVNETGVGYRLAVLAQTEAFRLRYEGEKRVKHIRSVDLCAQQ